VRQKQVELREQGEENVGQLIAQPLVHVIREPFGHPVREILVIILIVLIYIL
jgi:hypothetical protein